MILLAISKIELSNIQLDRGLEQGPNFFYIVLDNFEELCHNENYVQLIDSSVVCVTGEVHCELQGHI